MRNETQQTPAGVVLESAPLALLRRIDAGLLTILVIAADLHRTAAKRIANSGGELLTTTPNGHQQPRLKLSILNRQALIMIRTAAELGFAPSSRSRIALGDTQPNEDNDDLAERVLPDLTQSRN